MAVVSWQGNTESFNYITVGTLDMADLYSGGVVQSSYRYVEPDGQN
jgi:hypothetical protein